MREGKSVSLSFHGLTFGRDGRFDGDNWATKTERETSGAFGLACEVPITGNTERLIKI